MGEGGVGIEGGEGQGPTLTVAWPPGASKMTCRASENHKLHARPGK